jgi:hypothetical protein
VGSSRDDTNATHEPRDLDTILAGGWDHFHAWLCKQAAREEPIIFHIGHPVANPVTCYINHQLGDATGQAHLYEGMIYTACGARAVPEALQRFLWALQDAFGGQHVTPGTLVEWIALGQPLPYQPDLSAPEQRMVEICHALEMAVALVRQGFRDPAQVTEEECLGIAVAKYCSWDGPRIARTCLRLCYAALEDANYATLERLLQEHFGEETFR